jgi:hypothetical protein
MVGLEQALELLEDSSSFLDRDREGYAMGP